MQDLTFAARGLRKNIGFTLIAVITLALGIGANTAIFSVIKAVLLNRMPYADADRLVTVAEAGKQSRRDVSLDFQTAQDWMKRNRTLSSIALFRDASGAIVEGEEAELLDGMRVSANFFDTLGVKVRYGRTFLAEEDQPDRRFEIILSHSLWAQRFGSDPNVIGRVIKLNDRPYTVVGILGPDFQPLIQAGRRAPQMYLPLGYSAALPMACRTCRHLQAIGRLKDGVSLDQARADLSGIMNQLIAEYPGDYQASDRAVVGLLRERLFGKVSTNLWLLLGAVGFVLLIACANVANLLLARATTRTKEVSLRAALGAGRMRIIRQLLTESSLLAVIGGAAGVVLAAWATSLIASSGPRAIPRIADIRMDPTVLLFAFAVSLVTGLLFGLAPAVRASKVDLNDALKGAGKSTSGAGSSTIRNVLVIAELAMAFVLVAGAGLLGRSFVNLLHVNPGYDAHNVLTLNTFLYGPRYAKSDAVLAYGEQGMEKVHAIPGVENVALSSTLPLAGFDWRSLHVQDRHLAHEADAPNADAYSVSPEYFQVMRIPLKRGRLFTAQDRGNTPQVAVISEACARQVFPNEDPIGKHIQLGGRSDKDPWATIVGIVGDVRQHGLESAPGMEAYLVQAQHPEYGYNIVVRTSSDPVSFERPVRDAFLSVDRTQPLFNVMPLEALIQTSLVERTFTLSLLGAFGLLALVLASIGIYGVISYSVNIRIRELGIRLALGANSGDVLAMILKQGMTLAAIGLTLGFAASLGLARLLSTMLFEVRPSDLGISAAVAATLALSALAACYIPARRAAKVELIIALRNE